MVLEKFCIHCWCGADWKIKLPRMVKNIKHTMIFNDLWDEICEGEDDSGPTKSTVDKDLTIWKK
jgi:hypothetical protein